MTEEEYEDYLNSIEDLLLSDTSETEEEYEDYEYYEKTEALLDSINNWDNSFMDTVMETDAYYEYEVAKQNLQ